MRPITDRDRANRQRLFTLAKQLSDPPVSWPVESELHDEEGEVVWGFSPPEAEFVALAYPVQIASLAADIQRLREALAKVLADDGNCTANEPQDSSCPRCQARALLKEGGR